MAKKQKTPKSPKTYEAKLSSIEKLVNSIKENSTSFEIASIIKNINSHCGSSFVTKIWANALISQKYLELMAEDTDLTLLSDELLPMGDATGEDEGII
jgi:predicted patatin/cPLA2 family phospholipase